MTFVVEHLCKVEAFIQIQIFFDDLKPFSPIAKLPQQMEPTPRLSPRSVLVVACAIMSCHNCTCGMPDVCILINMSVIASRCLFNLCTCTVQSVYVQSVCCSVVASCRVAFVVSIILCRARERTRRRLRLATSKSRHIWRRARDGRYIWKYRRVRW